MSKNITMASHAPIDKSVEDEYHKMQVSLEKSILLLKQFCENHTDEALTLGLCGVLMMDGAGIQMNCIIGREIAVLGLLKRVEKSLDTINKEEAEQEELDKKPHLIA